MIIVTTDLWLAISQATSKKDVQTASLNLLVGAAALLFYVHGKHLRSCQDGQLT